MPTPHTTISCKNATPTSHTNIPVKSRVITSQQVKFMCQQNKIGETSTCSYEAASKVLLSGLPHDPLSVRELPLEQIPHAHMPCVHLMPTSHANISYQHTTIKSQRNTNIHHVITSAEVTCQANENNSAKKENKHLCGF